MLKLLNALEFGCKTYDAKLQKLMSEQKAEFEHFIRVSSIVH